MAFEFLNQQVEQQKQLARFRSCQSKHLAGDNKIIVDGKTYINFSSNDYLGLNHHPIINKAMQEGVDKFGLCSSSASLITGYQYPHQALESEICQWLNVERCLLFTSGFAANTGVLSALGQPSVAMFLDKLSHASLIDGGYQSKAKVKRFLHNDCQSLRRLLQANSAQDKLIVTEGVFSMDGDLAPVKAITELASSHQAKTLIDDAHSIGVIGEQGQGSLSYAKTDFVVATLGKALASSGAFVTCDNTSYDYLVNFARHYIFSTAMSPAIAWATVASIKLAQQEHWRREKIKELSEIFKNALVSEISLLKTDSSIHAIVIGDETKTLAMSEQLKNDGFWVAAIRPPTVKSGTSRLRVTICANHKENEIKALAESINRSYDNC